VTRGAVGNVWLHPVEPAQLIPAGLEVTLPLPPTVTCSESFCTAAANVAPTLWARSSAPSRSERSPRTSTRRSNYEGIAGRRCRRQRDHGAAWIRMAARAGTGAINARRIRSDRAGPPTVTWSGSICPPRAKLAETSGALATITQSAVVPEHAPPHPINVWSVAGAALRVTIVPSGNVWLQLFGPTHCSPVGLEVTVPEPPMETTKGAVCATVDVGFGRSTGSIRDISTAACGQKAGHRPRRAQAPHRHGPRSPRRAEMLGGKCSAPLRKRSLKPTNKK